ncbi:hypothetical protein K8354_12740 [Polaribacter litorisediminis]|uniref:hypothetical protein n=1 Tax=Polaribacter litorisediminis TaxID=1908341 RepID=UPI001CBECD1D|nr:hypothetical protein [Polaribacter litorisediminis]UAM97180.1 hypothetical protein K8354_12740 [Polaribacter litorisediminis]
MKETLEYKILKHLSENNNGKLIDISGIEEKKEKLKSVIKDLKEREFIETERHPPTVKISGNWVSSGNSDKPDKCKIKFLGTEYLESLKPKTIPNDRKLYLILFMVFSCIGSYGTYKTIFPNVSESEFENLNRKYDSIVKLNLLPIEKKLDSTLTSKSRE